jgi:tRNA(Ile)-lysidine synthase
MIPRAALPQLDELALIGVSGGRDSVALLDLLAGFGAKLIVCHLDHALRPESAAEALQVEKLAARYGLPFATCREEVIHRAKAQKESLETAARNTRYEFFAHVAQQHGCERLYLAHHADDQVETVLLQLLRGAGSAGLSGMAPVSTRNVAGVLLQVCRPLLGTWREEIDRYITQRELPFCDDASNQDLRFTRNRIRLELLPALDRAFGRSTRASLLRSAEILAAEDDYLQQLADPQSTARELSTTDLRALPLALQRRVLHTWLKHEQVPEVGFAEVEAVRALLSSGPAKVNLPGGFHARRRAKRLFIEPGVSASGKHSPLGYDSPHPAENTGRGNTEI